MHVGSLGSTESSSMNLELLSFSHVVLYFEIRTHTFVNPSVYYWE